MFSTAERLNQLGSSIFSELDDLRKKRNGKVWCRLT